MGERFVAKPYRWSDIIAIIRSHRPQLIKANGVAIFATLTSVPVPLLFPLLVDELFLEQPGSMIPAMRSILPEAWVGPVGYVALIFVVSVLLRILTLIFHVWQQREFTIISKEVVFRIRKRVLENLQRVSMAEYESLGSGAVASHLVTDLDTVDNFLGPTVSKLLVALFSMVGTAVVLLWMHWQLALLILLFNPVVIYFTTMLGQKMKELKRRENHAFEAFQQALAETLDAVHQIRASNRERHYILRLVDRARGVQRHSEAYEWQSNAANRFSFLIFLFGLDLFRSAAMLTVVFSDLTVGQMFAVYGYLWFMMTPVQDLLSMQYQFYSANAALRRVNKLLQLQHEPQYPAEIDPFAGRQTVSVELNNVGFGYHDGQTVLQGINLNIVEGQKVALVSPSGGGKSTLIQLLLGIYPADCGSISYAGVPLEKIGYETVRENVATVLQHPMLFNDTLRNNLTMGRDYQEEELWHALGVAQLRDSVEAMPQGIETVVGRQGIRLSGGQRQRLAIARMVLSKPKVVILDEATSALDTETEHQLHRALETFLKGRTTIIIAHRLSAVKQADLIYVLEGGLVTERGEHQQLLDAGGLYARLYGKHQHI